MPSEASAAEVLGKLFFTLEAAYGGLLVFVLLSKLFPAFIKMTGMLLCAISRPVLVLVFIFSAALLQKLNGSNMYFMAYSFTTVLLLVSRQLAELFKAEQQKYPELLKKDRAQFAAGSTKIFSAFINWSLLSVLLKSHICVFLLVLLFEFVSGVTGGAAEQLRSYKEFYHPRALSVLLITLTAFIAGIHTLFFTLHKRFEESAG